MVIRADWFRFHLASMSLISSLYFSIFCFSLIDYVDMSHIQAFLLSFYDLQLYSHHCYMPQVGENYAMRSYSMDVVVQLYVKAGSSFALPEEESRAANLASFGGNKTKLLHDVKLNILVSRFSSLLLSL